MALKAMQAATQRGSACVIRLKATLSWINFLALERGLVALRDGKTFSAGIDAVIRMGGDADTNAAIAGALLGARDGYHAIPDAWLEKLQHKDTLSQEFERLMHAASTLGGDAVENHDGYALIKPFLERFNAPGYTIAGNSTDPETGLAGWNYKPEVLEFKKVVADHFWRPFKLGEWRASAEAKLLFSSTEAVSQATSEDVAKLLTSIVRAEHSGVRLIETSFESGILIAALQRLAVLGQ